jgi:hypothetical protein
VASIHNGSSNQESGTNGKVDVTQKARNGNGETIEPLFGMSVDVVQCTGSAWRANLPKFSKKFERAAVA